MEKILRYLYIYTQVSYPFCVYLYCELYTTVDVYVLSKICGLCA